MSDDPMLDGITRYDIGPDRKLITAKMVERDNGQYVDVLDVIALLAAAREDERGKAKVEAYARRHDPTAAYEQGQRDVFAYHPEWTVTGMCKPDCLPCQRLTELIDERSAGYAEGQRDEREACIRAIEALPDWTFCDAVCGTEQSAVAAIRARGEKP